MDEIVIPILCDPNVGDVLLLEALELNGQFCSVLLFGSSGKYFRRRHPWNKVLVILCLSHYVVDDSVRNVHATLFHEGVEESDS